MSEKHVAAQFKQLLKNEKLGNHLQIYKHTREGAKEKNVRPTQFDCCLLQVDESIPMVLVSLVKLAAIAAVNEDHSFLFLVPAPN